MTHGARLVRSLCPRPPDDERPPLPICSGPLDAISDALRALHFDAYVLAVRDELTGKASRRRVHPFIALALERELAMIRGKR